MEIGSTNSSLRIPSPTTCPLVQFLVFLFFRVRRVVFGFHVCFFGFFGDLGKGMFFFFFFFFFFCFFFF